MFKHLDEYFTLRRKGIAALCALGFALLWMILWKLFPMEFYSLFYSSIVGSNIQLLLLNIVVLLPLLWVFTKLTKTGLSFSRTALTNILMLIAADYVFSIFAFSGLFFICVISLLIHAAVNIWIFGGAEIAASGERAIKKQPLITVIWAAVFAFTTEAASFALLYAIAHIYVY